MNTIYLPKERIHAGNLILVNREHAYVAAKQETNILLPAKEAVPSVQLHPRAAILLNQLMQDIKGWEAILPMSGWRSVQEQQSIWDQTSQERGHAFTATYVARPGHSEHHTGLAIDLGLNSECIDPICPSFPYSGICQVFRQQAAKYGFVERYLKGKEQITGIGHEPWHFRYVGAGHAHIMTMQGFVLEEYISFIKQFTHSENPYQVQLGTQAMDISYLRANEEGNTKLELDAMLPYSISGNNVDGFVITQWRM